MTLCKIATQDDQKIFEKRLKESAQINIKPVNLSVSNYFTLDKNTDILEFYRKQCVQQK